MEAWANFFLGELSAAAALAGLLFVSMSVNQARILALGHMADRGADALLLLLLVLLVASLMLIPAQGPRLAGAEIVVVALALSAALASLERRYVSAAEAAHRGMALRVAVLGQAAVWLIVAAGLVLAWRNDWAGLYPLAAGILLAFVIAGVDAWVLLIEINR